MLRKIYGVVCERELHCTSGKPGVSPYNRWGRRSQKSNNFVKKLWSIWFQMVTPSKGPCRGLEVKTGQWSQRWKSIIPTAEKAEEPRGVNPEWKSCKLRDTKIAAPQLSCPCTALVMQPGEKYITGRNQNSLRSRNRLKIDRLQKKKDKRWIAENLFLGLGMLDQYLIGKMNY